MTIEKWLENVHYDEFGTFIWNRNEKGGNQMIAEVRGWGAIQNLFKSANEAAKFQDEVAEFIVQAIREKIARTSSQTEISDEEIEESSKYIQTTNPDLWTFKIAWKSGAKWYREQLKQRQ